MTLWNPESPFLETPSFSPEAFEEESYTFNYDLQAPWASGETPFLRDEYETQGVRGAELEAVSELLTELRDEAFEDGVHRLAAEAVNFLGDRYDGELGESEAQAAEAERQLENFFSPLVREAENMYERMSQGLERQDLTLLSSELELESFLSQYAPVGENLEPEFEDFLGKLFKKAGSFVKGAINFAKKGISAIGGAVLRPLLNKLKLLVKPLITKVIRFALNRLPVGVRPIAQRLARRLFGQVAGELETESGLVQNAVGAEVIQQEYDLQLAELLLSSEMELEQNTAEFEQPEALPVDPALALHAAKQKFIQEFSQLEKGQDPAPVVQNFLPIALLALRPIIKTVIGIIGRPKIINFLGGLIAKLIQRWVGPEGARLLSTSLVDVGLGLLGFETTFEAASVDPRTNAAEIIAETLEHTVLQIAQLPEQVLENETMLEAYAREAFEQAASAYFPDSSIRTELRESQLATGNPNVWVSMPRNRKRKYYRKFSRVIDVVISPSSKIKIFGGATLSDFFRDILLLPPDKPIKAKVHLYELNLGSRLIDIAKREKNVPGLGSLRRESWSQFHPLTTEAASELFKEPGLGKSVDSRFLDSPNLVAIGQRFYFLQIPGAIVPTNSGKSKEKCLNAASLTVNLQGARIVTRFQFSEQIAQQIAQNLRRQDFAGAFRIVKAMEPSIRNSKFKLIGFEMEDYLGVSTEGQVAAASGAGILASLAGKLLEKIIGKVFDLIWEGVANFFKNTANEFIRAADDPSDGVTMYVSFVNIPGLSQIRDFRQGKGGILDKILSSLSLSIPRPSISILPGCNK
jgi:hypothetical protein